MEIHYELPACQEYPNYRYEIRGTQDNRVTGIQKVNLNNNYDNALNDEDLQSQSGLSGTVKRTLSPEHPITIENMIMIRS